MSEPEKKGCCEALAERVDELETAMLALIEGLDVRLCGLEQRAADVEKAAEEFLDRGTSPEEPFVGTNVGMWIVTCEKCGVGVTMTPRWKATHGMRCEQCAKGTGGYWTCLRCGIAKPNPYGDPKAYSGICRECVKKQRQEQGTF